MYKFHLFTAVERIDGQSKILFVGFGFSVFNLNNCTF